MIDSPSPDARPSWVTPVTRESVTQADIDLLNLLRLGMIPIVEWDSARNKSLASRWSSDLLSFLVKPKTLQNSPLVAADLDALRLFVDKSMCLLTSAKVLIARFEREKGVAEIADGKAKIKDEVAKRDRAKIEEASQKPQTSPGARRYTAEEKVLKPLLKSLSKLTKEQQIEMAHSVLEVSGLACDYAKVQRLIEGLK